MPNSKMEEFLQDLYLRVFARVARPHWLWAKKRSCKGCRDPEKMHTCWNENPKTSLDQCFESIVHFTRIVEVTTEFDFDARFFGAEEKDIEKFMGAEDRFFEIMEKPELKKRAIDFMCQIIENGWP